MLDDILHGANNEDDLDFDICQKLINDEDLNTKNSSGFSPLLVAIWKEFPEICKMLFKAGADVNTIDSAGWTAPMWAVWMGEGLETEVLGLLIERGANLDVRDYIHGETALFKAIDTSDDDHNERVRMLIEAGANVNIRNIDGNTALMKEVEAGYEWAVTLLIEAGTDIEIKNNTGETALILAAKDRNGMGQPKSIEALIDAGAEVNVKDNLGRTPIIWAVDSGYAEIVRMLVDAGAGLSTEDNEGWTALTVALSRNMFVIAQILIDHGADEEINDPDGRRMIKEVVQYLRYKSKGERVFGYI